MYNICVIIYNPNAPTKVSVETSSFGLRAILLQKNDNDWNPIVIAPRSVTEVKHHNAQVERKH